MKGWRLFSKGFLWVFLVYLVALTLLNTATIFFNIYIGEYGMAWIGIAVGFLGLAGISSVYKSIKK